MKTQAENIEKLQSTLSDMDITSLSIAFIEAKSLLIKYHVSQAIENLLGEDGSAALLSTLR